MLRWRTRGFPRLVNIVRPQGLMCSYGRGKKSVGLREMKEAIADTASLRLRAPARGVGRAGDRRPVTAGRGIREKRMSVINTMLQDLDKRNGRPGGEAVAGDAIRSTKPPVGRGDCGNVLLMLRAWSTASAAGAWWTAAPRRGRDEPDRCAGSACCHREQSAAGDPESCVRRRCAADGGD